ncbi:MAG: nicotinate (nicotinamide) nucleotide adenylyltransferase [Verrucomicrobiales bacterium]|nr:nicotinate (nicotinamide) nucleotide adenylyltransferase [Verrucomicrobiales bacterium]
MRKIGLFGGSFDPVHLGHVLVAQAACEEFGLERLIFIPAAQSPFKPESKPASATHRVQLLRLALAGEPNFEIDAQEIQRGGTSFTIDTVRDWQSRCPDCRFFWLIGADHVPTLDKWRDANELADALEFLVIPRPGQEAVSAPEPFRIHMLKGFPLGVSSSQIRERVVAGLPVKHLTGSRVAEAIRNNGLYL